MRYSQLFGRTRHSAPADADSINAKLLTQGGFIDQLAAGIYNILPLGYRVLKKINQIIIEEMNAVGGQQLQMPALHPVDLWETTGRNRTMDEILYRTKGAGNKDFVLGPSHEETVTPLAAKYIQSYKDLPVCVYQLQTKFRNEARAKSGLIRGREFGMKDMYSFHNSDEDLDRYYEEVKQAYLNVYKRCGMEVYVIEASGGPFSDKYSHEFSVPAVAGEDTIILCDKCKIAQNLEIAAGHLPVGADDEKELATTEIKIERGFSVEDNAKAHGVPAWKILKTVVYEVEEMGLIGVVIRGDLNINETKLENYLKKLLRAASPEALKKAGLVQGYISPVGVPDKIGISFIGDNSIKTVKNFVTGANKPATDLKNVNIGRDFVIADFADFVEVKGGFKCPKCGGDLREIKAVEAGNIFKLGTRYSKDFNLNFSDKDGKSKPVVMGCYGIGNTRMIGTIVEAKHDKNGMIWPLSVSPYQIHLVSLGKDEAVKEVAEKLYKELVKDEIEVLYDDRDESAGVKLKDADLIGIPLRLVISNRTLENKSVEWKLRAEKESEIVKIPELKKKIQKFLTAK